MKPSSSKSPDLDWSQVRETVLMLNLAVSQIVHAMKDGDESVTELAKMFTSIIEHVQSIGMAARNIDEEEEKTTITASFEEISEKVNSAIVSFQFYDQLAQRLSHVCHSLDSLGKLRGDPERL